MAGAAKMAPRQLIQLGSVEETLLVPLYARAVDARKKHPLLNDRKAVEMVQSIDWDFQRFSQWHRIVGCTVRCAMFDEWVKDFLTRCPNGTVVEIGAGLNTRFERLDNGTAHWFDLDLPDAITLRRRFFADSERRVTLASSVVDPGWMAAVRESPAPYLFVAETVFMYLQAQEVKAALAQIAGTFPRLSIAFDTGGQLAIDRVNKEHEHLKLNGRFAWACEDPKEIEDWNIGLHLVESRSGFDVPDPLRPRLSLTTRAVFDIFSKLLPKFARIYRLNLFAGQ